MLNRRSFLTGLIAAPVIVHAANIMPVRAIELLPKTKTLADLLNDLYYGDKSLSFGLIKSMIEIMKESSIPAFSREGIPNEHYVGRIHPIVLTEAHRRFRAINSHYRGEITHQMALDFI